MNIKVNVDSNLQKLNESLSKLKETGEIVKNKEGDNFQEVQSYVESLKEVQDLSFRFASESGYCYICGSYPNRPTKSKGFCSRCGSRP